MFNREQGSRLFYSKPGEERNIRGHDINEIAELFYGWSG